MDAFELLKNDHKKVSQLFKEIEAASGQAKKQIFSRLQSELDIHAHIEEEIFYPALENKGESRDITLEAYEEHKVVKDLLAELANGGGPSDEWDAKLTVLKENVEHHVEEEEGELFSKTRKVLSKEEIERCGAQMTAEKSSQKREGAAQPQRAKRQAGAAQSPKKQSQESESPGVLKRIASLVGLGSSSSSNKKKTASKGRKPSKGRKASAGESGSSKGAARKASKKATKRNGRGTAKAAGKRRAATGRSKADARSGRSKKTTKRAATKISRSR